MNYAETLNYLFRQLPMYQRQGAVAFKKDLSNTLALCAMLDNPQNKFKSIHVAGTNGKGSVSHLLASVFQCAGYKVGLYTSPHLKDFRERIRINGKMIAEQEVVDFVAEHRSDFEQIKPSFFEMTVALAFYHFAKNQVDIAIVETGLGGRLDSTNVLIPELSVITNIGLDHQQFLGDTLGEIAGEKAGIIKKNVPVIIGEFQQEIAEVFENKARETNSILRFADREWEIRDQKQTADHLSIALRHYDGMELTVESQLTGPHQPKNLTTALAATRMLSEAGWNLTREHFKQGVNSVVDRTGLQGRWQILQTQPTIICDNGHNKEALVPNIERLLLTHKEKQLHFVWGMVNDKDVRKTLELLPKGAKYYFCRPNVPRGLDVSVLQKEGIQLGLSCSEYGSVAAAIAAARNSASETDLIYIGGSTFVVAEAV
ncbi:MAG: bifunctional folylpolyglutamate synthase/dihydrofolate synthase [Flavobacteriales bacterium]|nr:bifunctional folylpolyglutamate synthase/dihydrofolate synthase [Flavobacteriales bacterium]